MRRLNALFLWNTKMTFPFESPPMNPLIPVRDKAEPVPHSHLLPPLRALIEAMDEFVYSGELDAVSSGSMSWSEMFHGHELSTALHEVLESCRYDHPQFRNSTFLESAICLDLKNLVCPVLVFWSYLCQTSGPRGTDGGVREMFEDSFSLSRNEARRYAEVLETGRWKVEME